MDIPTTAPLTPLGAKTPHAHPALYGVITGLVIVIAVGALWVFWPHSAVAPEPSSSPTPTLSGPGEHCGGNMTTAAQCRPGFHCAPDPSSHLPFGDVGGICTADAAPTASPSPSQGDSVGAWSAHVDSTYGFSFWYPAYLKANNDMGPNHVPSLVRNTSYTVGDGGVLTVGIYNVALTSVQTLYEGLVPVSKLDTIRVDGRAVYTHSDGDAGCGGTSYYMSLTESSYLQLSYGDCEGQVTTIRPDIQTILSSFRFSATPAPAPSAPPQGGTPVSQWRPFSSKYFTLLFKVPPGFEVRDSQDSIRIAQAPFTNREIGDDNAFFALTRYVNGHSKAERMAAYRTLLKNAYETKITVAGTDFPMISGDDWGRFEGDSAGTVIVVFFEKSWLEIIQRPANSDQRYDPINIGQHILSTFKFSK